MNWTTDEQKKLRDGMWKHGLCGCGSGTSYEVLRELLERAAENDEGGERTGFYKPMSDASPRWAEFGAHVMDVMDLVDHGTGIGWPWLTDGGRLLLRFLREFGCDDDKWPEWATSDDGQL